MILKTSVYGIVIPFFCVVVTLQAQDNYALYPLDITGTGGLRNGAYRKALDTLRRNREPDSSFRLFKLGIAHACVGDTAKAISRFRACAIGDSAIAPFAWEAIADIASRRKGLDDSALSCYSRAVAAGIPDRYRTSIFEKITALIADDTARIAPQPYAADYKIWYDARGPRPPDSLILLADTLIGTKQWRQLDSLLTRTLATLDAKRQVLIIKAIGRARLPDSALTAAAFFQVALSAMEQRLLTIAERMLAAAKRKSDFNAVISDRRFQYVRGLISFYGKKYGEAAPVLARYVQAYGLEPDLALIIARAYWSLDSTAKAAYWYDRYIERYPTAKPIPEILWRRAWIEEERKRFPAALGFYKRLYTSHPRSPRAEEANLRHAFCLYQTGAYDSAITVFNEFDKKNPSSALSATARYWKAKCLVAREKIAEAATLLVEVARAEPHEYYAHRARYLLRLCNDSINADVPLDTIEDDVRTLNWLDSLTADTQRPLTAQDSMNLRRGLVLGAIGAGDASSIFLEPIELSFPGNLSLQYRLALFYNDIKALSQAAMAGRRFGWRLPLESRQCIPLSLYRLMYPTYYKEEILRESLKWNLDPCFVWAVMRQESVFNHKVVSPAGAVGLMQIMPGTGREIAREQQREFHVDSLYIPDYNIQFGTWYLRKLLDQFNENDALAVASYNGGPRKAKEWYLRNQSEDLDLYVENIGFSETRNYVKKVLANHWTYRRLTRLAVLTKDR
ncbi:MAG: transglycosylase SLT domain-containing protein [Chitinispirillaceae bacterium]|nr:transglycosylase SLT domain-containing protein [Chitinispirillaceae bacterium]